MKQTGGVIRYLIKREVEDFNNQDRDNGLLQVKGVSDEYLLLDMVSGRF